MSRRESGAVMLRVQPAINVLASANATSAAARRVFCMNMDRSELVGARYVSSPESRLCYAR